MTAQEDSVVDKYAKSYANVVRYGADHSTIENIAKQLTNPDLIGDGSPEHDDRGRCDRTKRLVLADALQDNGRDHEADLLRNLNQVVAYHEGKIKPGVVRYRNAAFDQSGDTAHEVLDYINEHGPSAALNYVASNYDMGEGSLHESNGHGSNDRTYSEGNHILTWNHGLGYWGLTEQHVLPEEHAKATHYNNGRVI